MKKQAKTTTEAPAGFRRNEAGYLQAVCRRPVCRFGNPFATHYGAARAGDRPTSLLCAGCAAEARSYGFHTEPIHAAPEPYVAIRVRDGHVTEIGGVRSREWIVENGGMDGDGNYVL